jgi:hypothetical protein
MRIQRQAKNAPAGFWGSSARECFNAARSILHLCSVWKEADVLPSTPFVAYALHTAACIDLYGTSFPWMCYYASNPSQVGVDADQEDSIDRRLEAQREQRLVSTGFAELSVHVQLVDGWKKNMASMKEYFHRVKADFERVKADGSSNAEERSGDGLRDGGAGTGEGEYSLFERSLRDFGNLESD